MTYGHRQHWAHSRYGARDLDFDDLTLDVEPTDRFGPPVPNRFKARLRKTLVTVTLAAGVTWAVASDPERAQGWLVSAKSFVEAVVSNAREIAERAEQERAALHPDGSAASAGPAMEPIAPIAEVPAPAHDDKIPPAAGENVSTGSIGTAYAETPAPAAEASQDKSPKRAQAVAAGLGPDLPNVLLTRLSEADLKNAAYAIRTALAKTPDAAAFAWPPKPSRQQALFEIRFVAGAPQGCRRYIVTVTKDRWSSTSAALEKCGEGVLHAG